MLSPGHSFSEGQQQDATFSTGQRQASAHGLPTPVTSMPNNPKFSASMIEQACLQDYRPPGTHHSPSPRRHPASVAKSVQYVHNPDDGAVLKDKNGRPVSVAKLLATRPLRHEIMTRPGPGGKKLTYMSGETITRTLNDIFGYDGWDLSITRVQREECLKDEKSGKFTVCYTAQVRLTHKSSGAFREDCGAGDATDRSFGTAVANALKGSITDALKRAARHFGDKCGNSLYQGKFNINTAPKTLQEALDMYDVERANTKFGHNISGSVAKTPPKPDPTAVVALRPMASNVSTVAAASSVTSNLPAAPILPAAQTKFHTSMEDSSKTIAPPPSIASELQQQVVVLNAPPPRPKSSYGRPTDMSGTTATSSADTVDQSGRRVSIELTDQKYTKQEYRSQSQSSVPPMSTGAPLPPQSGTATLPTIDSLTYTKRFPLHNLPTDLGNQQYKHLSSSTSAASAAPVTSAPHIASSKRNAGMMTNPYSSQHSYPNKGGRNSI
ncbi:rad52/22 family double-strand break repair protein [Nitzschia inconspicua]|uniref:Rad52/22 family double-strand break repair protein n=1 Tax=Nitzschia inconspicua TaxID=303405 RepID=A0A9K3KB98_9STRA|nr:rad52/22 family double-strand break repair protein [Nitzschia inconspicua]